ncbi:MAG TPA: LacI family DNA-binding transcriptional regulator [Streptosporangiaceae bacterium]|nr:LacI family DNA-binding transcriptional regulator [Streptosporangiaceae bacterium]
MAVTLSDVAQAAGVHPGTASRALNPATRSRVSPATARRVLAAASRLGYLPNSLARGLRTRRSYTVGIMIPDLTNPLFPPIVRGVDEVLGPAGYSGLVANTDNDQTREELLFAALRSRQADGFIVATAHREHALLDRMAEAEVPMVLVNRTTENRAIPAVVPDEAAGIRTVVRRLAALGHRRIAHLAGPQILSTGHGRYRAYLDAMAGQRLEPGPVAFADGFTEAAGRAAGGELLAARPRPTAVVAGNDLLAIGLLDLLQEAGLDCPGDVSVVGFNDHPMLARMATPLTTVRIPQREIGAEAARLLLDLLTEPGPAKMLLLPTQLIERASTAPPPAR